MYLPTLIFLVLPISIWTFECYTCNPESTKNGPCIDRKTVCRDSSSCSMAVIFQNGRSIVRKFCTPPNTPIYQYLMMMPGASMCQNNDISEFANRRTRRHMRGPPAQPGDQMVSLLCVCTTPLCNKGTYSKVLENTMLNNLPHRLLPPISEFEKVRREESENTVDDTMAQQMADAGF